MPNAKPSRRTIGYARVSTRGQDLAYQLERLRSAGCGRIYQEKKSGKNTNERAQLEKMLRMLRPGDLILATVSDRVARDPLDLVQIIKTVRETGAQMRMLDEPFIDTANEMVDVIAYILGWAARWNRLRILENTAWGRTQARERGVKFGRQPKLTPRQKAEACLRRQSGERLADLAIAFGVSESTIIRLVRTVE